MLVVAIFREVALKMKSKEREREQILPKVGYINQSEVSNTTFR